MAKQTDVKPVKTFKDQMKDALPSLNAVAPVWISAERIIRVMLASRSRNPIIKKCTPESVLLFCMDCARTGLEPIGAGGAWPVPFKNGSTGQYEVQFIPDWRGLIFIAKKTGQIKNAKGVVVHENDEFDYQEGDDPYIHHKPNIINPGKMIGAYCIITLLDGSKEPTFMRLDEIDSIMKRSKAKESGPWKTDKEQMSIKTVVKRALKPFAGSPEMQYAIALDNKITGLREPIREPMEIDHEEILNDESEIVPDQKQEPKQEKKKDQKQESDQGFSDPNIPPADLFPDGQ